MTDGIDAAPAGSPGELGVLPRREELVAFPVVFRQLLDDDGSGRHVDAECEGFGGEDDLHEAERETRFDRLFERWNHAGVVARDACGEPAEPLVVAENGQVSVGQVAGVFFGDGPDTQGLVAAGEAHPRCHTGRHCVVAGGPGENEVDRRHEIEGCQLVDDLDPARRRESWPRPPRWFAAGLDRCGGVEAAAFGVGLAIDQGRDQVEAVTPPFRGQE